MFYSKVFLIVLTGILLLLGDLPHLGTTSTTTTLIAAMSIANQDFERYFRTANATQVYASMAEERSDLYAFLKWSYTDDKSSEESNYTEEKARYGEGKILNVTGILVHITSAEDVKDDYACKPNILGTNGKLIPNKPWVALVRRGHCTFEDKVRNVYQQKASGVIIYNDKQVMQLEKMQIKDKTRNITAVITYLHIGVEMAKLVDANKNVTISIISGRSGKRPISSLNRTSVLFVSISFIVLMIISLVWLIFYYIQRFRYLQAKDQQSRNLCSVTKKAIMKIPTKTGKMTDEKDIDSDCCAICIESYKPADIIRILPCKHEFHKTCIDPWLIEHRTCPMCKLDVLKFYGFMVGDQIQQAPSPQHLIPANYAHIIDNNHDVPVIVVAMPPQPTMSQSANLQIQLQSNTAVQQSNRAQQQQQPSHHLQQMLDTPNTSRFQNSSNPSHSSRSNFSNNDNNINNRNFSTNGVQRRNSAPASVVMQQVSTASRHVTDV